MKHCGTQTIESQRLLLRQFCMEDCNDMLNNWISSEKIQFEYGEPVYTTESQVNELLDKWISNYSNPDFYRWSTIIHLKIQILIDWKHIIVLKT